MGKVFSKKGNEPQPTLSNGWNFDNDTSTKKITGYEAYDHILSTYNRTKYKAATPKRKRAMERKIFSIYRGVNVFPVYYFNQDGINYEIQKLIKKQVNFDGNTLDMKHIQGLNLCRYLFPNLMKVEVIGDKASMYDRFYDDETLMKAIRFILMYDDNCKPSALLGGLRMTGTAALNFMPLRAQALYEHYAPNGGTILDFAHGFGGRMLGALTSSKNDYRYIGIDPNTETHENIKKLGTHIEGVTGRVDSFEVHCIGSEEYEGTPNSVDFAFSSPPYFNLEQYTDEDTQCYNKYPEIEEWFEGYVRKTIKMLFNVLKDGAYYAVNIADFKNGKGRVEYVDEWVRISQEEGFEYVKEVPMTLTRRRGQGHRDQKGEEKKKSEGIFVFRKSVK